ncbi:transposase, partial [Sulfitobacter pseudonitzschiae]|nr:transposase [Pseudosulfitobacter pseudonitzschiae]
MPLPKGRNLDNIFFERLWRTLKYECVYLHAWETGSQARTGVRNWMEFYNHRRPHKALGGRPPAVAYSLQIEATQPDRKRPVMPRFQAFSGCQFQGMSSSMRL